MPRLRLTRTQITEKAARDIKARTDARQAGLIREIAAERRLQYKRDQEQDQEDDEQEDNHQPREQEDIQQLRESRSTCLNLFCFCVLLVTANALFFVYLLTRKT